VNINFILLNHFYKIKLDINFLFLRLNQSHLEYITKLFWNYILSSTIRLFTILWSIFKSSSS